MVKREKEAKHEREEREMGERFCNFGHIFFSCIDYKLPKKWVESYETDDQRKLERERVILSQENPLLSNLSASSKTRRDSSMSSGLSRNMSTQNSS